MRQSGGSFDWWLERVHPADRERFAREVGAFLESGAREARLEYRFRRVAGDYVPVRDQVVVERGADGTPIRLVAMVEERVGGEGPEHPPAEPWTRHRDLFERIRDAVFVVDSRGRIEDFNPAFLDLLALAPESARGWPVARFYRDPGVWEGLVAELRRSGTVSDLEIGLRGGDGREIVALVSAVASFDAAGEYLGHQAILHDITARSHQEEEERLRAERLEGRV
ncbi:MAG TPA: PAS domain S-box protein, partial [Longimicrobiales bacterium]|nr:PAS domain S-box protein [Longimicrobiales bacterium]